MDDGMGFEGSKPTAAVWVALDAPFLWSAESSV